VAAQCTRFNEADSLHRAAVQAEPLLVTTMLTTGDAKGQRLGGTGELMDSNGYCK